MNIQLFKKEKTHCDYIAIGLYLPDFMINDKVFHWGETEHTYGVSFDTRLSLLKSYGFIRFDLKILGFGFCFAKQWDY